MKRNDRTPIEWAGPIRYPIRRPTITVRKSPCGNGTNTFDRWQMRIFKRVYLVTCSQSQLTDIFGFVQNL